MPIEIETAEAIAARILARVVSLSGDGAVLSGAHPCNHLVTALSEQYSKMGNFAQVIVEDILPSTAVAEGLDRIAREYNLRRGQAEKSTGEAVILGMASSVLPVGTTLVAPNGENFTTTQSARVATDATSAKIELQAEVAGVAGNQNAGVVLDLVSAVAGFETTATITAAGLTGGREVETDAAFRGRLVQAITKPARGGVAEDYVLWTLDLTAHGVAVSNAWAYATADTSGKVKVLALARTLRAGGKLAVGEIADIVAYIKTQQPLGFGIELASPALQATNIVVSSIGYSDGRDRAEVRAAVRTNLQEYFDSSQFYPGAALRFAEMVSVIRFTNGVSALAVSKPTGDVAANGPTTILTLGTLTFPA